MIAHLSRFVHATCHLFNPLSKRFALHRVWGLLYLCQFAAACTFELMGTPKHTLFW